MAIKCTSMLNPAPLVPMSDGVEFFVTECETVPAPDATPFAAKSEVFRECTVMVSFAKSDAERAALRPLRHALAFGRTSPEVCDGPEWFQKLPKRLSACLEAAGHGLVAAVVYAGSDDDSDAEIVQAAVDALHASFGASLAALVVVSGASHRFASVRGTSGFVRGARGTSAETARSMFLCLAMLTAPKTQTGIDVVDLLPVLGTASTPTVLADTFWMREGEGHLIPVSDIDANAVRGAKHLVAIPFVDGPWGRQELSRFSQAAMAIASGSGGAVIFAGDGAIAPSLVPTCVAATVILCLASSE